MLRLRTFGGLWLEGQDGPVNGTATRRRLALLTLVAASGRKGLSRDRILSLLWSESNEERGRHALAQTIYSMRRDFAGAPSLTGSTDLRLNLDALSADVLDFDDACTAGDSDTASSIYTGPFLDGFFLSDAPEFERWVEERRNDYARRAAQAFEALARSSGLRGDHTQSVVHWRRLAALDPYNARVAQELMTALASAGDRAAALAYARLYTTRMRDEIGAEPDSAVSVLAATLTRTDSPSTRAEAPTPAFDPADVAPYPTPEAVPLPVRRRWPWWVVGGATLVALIATAWLLHRNPVPFNERDWIVLADLENHTRDTLLDHALVAAAAAGLAQSRYLNVFPATRVRETLQRMRGDSATTFDETLAREVAVREGLRGVLVLHVGTLGSVFTLTGRVVDPTSGIAWATWTRTADRQDQLLSALDDLLRELRRGLGEARSEIRERTRPLPAVTTSSLEALRYFANGAEAWSRGRWREAQDQWSAAVRLDPSFAHAHQALGSLYYWLDDRASGGDHFDRALALVDRLPERERLWIEARTAGSRGNRGAEANRWRAYLDLYPDDRDAWYNLATTLKQGSRCAEAVAPFEQALRLDNEMVPAFINLATCYESLGRYPESIAAFHAAFALRPEERIRTAGDINRIYGFLLLKSGDSAQARATFAELLGGDPVQQANAHRSLGLLEMYYGRYERATTHLREAVLLNRAAEHGLSEYRNRLYLVNAYAALGRDTDAWAELEAAKQLANELTLSPTWAGFLLRHYARTGSLDEAGHLLEIIEARTNSESANDRSALLNARGEIALASGRFAEAIDAFELAYRLTPVAYQLEPLARALYTAGDDDLAEARYLELIAERPLGWEPQEAWVLARYQLGLLLEERDPATAADHYQQLLAQWVDADRDLVVLRDVHRRLAALGRDR